MKPEDSVKTNVRKDGTESIDFRLDGKTYSATVNDNEVKIKGVATYNRHSQEAIWQLQHSCGLQGFNGMTDNCYSCKHNGELREEPNNPVNKAIITIKGNYSENMSHMLTTELVAQYNKTKETNHIK